MTTTLSWVIGRGGLLGRHVEAALEGGNTRPEVWRPERPIGWHDTDGAAAELELEVALFLNRAARSGTPWRLFWCAGAGVVATPPEALAEETVLLARFLAVVADRLSGDSRLAEAGTLFFASSAGGVYAGTPTRPPFDELSAVGPLGRYGHEKLAQERLFTRSAEACGVDLLIGRLSNLYGPGQKLSKPQGLISHVGRAALCREPVSIYVPLDTIRDYLFAADAGRMVVEAMRRCDVSRQEGSPGGSTTKIFASEVETTVASVLGVWRQVLRRPLRVAFASSPAGHLQPRVLSFRSRIWSNVRGQPTLLPLGVDAVWRDQLTRLQATGIG